MSKIAELCQKTQNRRRPDFSYQARQEPFPQTDMGGDEGPVRQSGGRAVKGLSPQSQAPVRLGLLSGKQGHRPAGRRTRPLLHRDNANLSSDHRRRAHETA